MIGPISLKASFQNAIDCGDIKSYEELLAMVNAESLEVTRDGSTKEGIRYIGLRQPSGKRFRVYFNFGEPSECTFDSKCEAESRCKMAEGQLVGRPI